MQIDPELLAPRDRYRLLTHAFVPRPIAWMSTVSPAGVANLAPFSFCGAVTSEPLMLMVSVGRRRGARKDTADNLLATGEGVLHIPHSELVAQMVASSAELAPEVDEFEHVELAKARSVRVRAPRVAAAAIAMEVLVERHFEVGDGPVDLFLLRAVLLHLADEFLVDGVPQPERLSAIGRLGAASYLNTHSTFEMQRPE
ncbi:MAG: flavin reductase family protein [Planctomycetota bacterium]